jgi:PAS domain S-box-containing protein
MKKKILVAIEDVSLNKLIRNRLVKSGFRVAGSSSLQGMFKLIHRKSFDLLLLDIRFHKQEEESMMEEVQIPYIIVTDFKDEKRAIQLANKGASDYLLVDAGFFSLLSDRVKKLFLELSKENELQHSLAAMKGHETAIKTLLDTIQDPVYICSGNRQIQYANPALKFIRGNDVLDKKCYTAIFASSNKCEQCPNAYSLSDESLISQVEINTDKKARFFQMSVSPIKFQNGSISRLHILKDVTELTKARDEAASNEKKFRLLAENAIDIVWQMDLRLKFTYLSPSAETTLGYRIDEMLGRNLWEFTKRKDFVKMARLAMGAIRDYKNFTILTFETQIVHKNGEIIPIEITGKLLKDNSGKLIGLQGSTKDISRRVKAQSDLIKQHHLLRTLIDNIPDVIYVKDLSSRYILNNLGHQKELKVSSQEETLHKTDHDFYDKETAGEFYRDEQKIIDSGVPMINKEEYLSYSDGSNSWKLTTKVPIRDDKGVITGIAGINRDITERKLIEDELFKSRHELALRNKIANVFLTTESDQLFHDVLEIILSEFSSKLGFFGYINDKKELVCPSMSPKNMTDCKLKEKSLSIPHKSWKGIWGKSLLENRSIRANKDLDLPLGHIPIKNVLCVPISIKNELLGQICIANKNGGYSELDQQLMESIGVYMAPILHSYLKEERMKIAKEEAFNQLKEAKNKAEESDKLKSSFLLNLSHELRTPLNAIMGFSNVLANQTKEFENSSFLTEQIHTAGTDLIKMVEDTINMAKLESGQVELDPMKQEVRKTLLELKSDFEKKNTGYKPEIEFQLKDSTKGVVLDTDHEKLKSALYNLLDNAMKYSGGGRIELGGYRVNGSQLVLYVKDSGIGIPEDLQEAVFEKFRKVEDKHKHYRGNGLGLAISKGLVEVIGGSIRMESAPGAGTCVSIYLPIK